jgi:hypothetical protein
VRNGADRVSRVTHAPLEPFARGMLPVDPGNEIHWETSGNPDGEADGHGGVESMEEMARAKAAGSSERCWRFEARDSARLEVTCLPDGVARPAW